VFLVIVLLWYGFADMRRPLFFRTLLVLAGLSLISASRTAAQQTLSVEQFAKAIQKEMKRRKLRTVLVVDLANEEGRITEQTQAVTAAIFDSFGNHSGNPKYLRASPKRNMGQGAISAEDQASFQDLSVLCEQSDCNALLIGRVQILPAGKRVSLKIVSPQTRGVLGELTALLPVETGEPLSWIDPHASDAPPYAKAGLAGTSIPKCIACPDPNYSEEARSMKLQGVVILRVVISRDGTAERIVVMKGPGHGLERAAIDAVRRWKLQPARDRNGNPVPVEVPVEISFRLLR